MTTLTKADWETLEAELPEDGLVTDPVELITYEVDGGLNRGVPQAVAFPRSPDDVVGLVRWAAEHEMPLVAPNTRPLGKSPFVQSCRGTSRPRPRSVEESVREAAR